MNPVIRDAAAKAAEEVTEIVLTKYRKNYSVQEIEFEVLSSLDKLISEVIAAVKKVDDRISSEQRS